jgi:hypothetical protein
MTNQLLLNDNLKAFIEKLNISQEQKDALLAKVPLLNKEDRIKLFSTLGEIYILNLEEKETLAKIQADWDK